jgi:hypothetical protein
VTLYLQDGAVSGHAGWCEQALRAGCADGVVISPFFTPTVPRRYHTVSGVDFADRVRRAGGEVIFDATTHALGLPGVDNWTSYNTWSLWEGARGDLTTDDLRLGHIDRVFAHQDALGTRRLIPSVSLDSPNGADAETALALAEAGRASDPAAWQTLAGRRGLWLSADLDALLGVLVQLRAPVWMLTVVRERPEYPPDMTEVALMEAVCRTVHSLAVRSRVIVCHADLFGLPMIAAGGDSIGTGWHGKQRVCAPATFQRNDPENIRRQAVWHTFEALYSRLHTNESTALFRADAALGGRLHAGPLDAGSQARREHHLAVVRRFVERVNVAGSDPSNRVAALRAGYESAIEEFEALRTRFGRPFGVPRAQHLDGCYEALRAYAEAESIW